MGRPPSYVLRPPSYGVRMTSPASPVPPPGPHAHLPRVEFGFPGPLRDRLVTAVLNGTKTATTSLLREYEGEGEYEGEHAAVRGDGYEAGREGEGEGGRGTAEPLPRAGARGLVLDSAGEAVAVIETTSVRIVPLAEVDEAHARDEGEGHGSVARWRAAHEEFWHGEDMRAALGEPGFTVGDDTEVVLERFRVVADLRTA